MAEVSGGVFRDGMRIMRAPSGELRQIDPKMASDALASGASDVTDADVQAVERANDPSLSDQLKAVGAGVLSGASGMFQEFESVARPIAKYVPGWWTGPAWASEAIQRAVGIDTADPSRPLPAQIAGLAAGAAALTEGKEASQAQQQVESQYLESQKKISEQSPSLYQAGKLGGEIVGSGAFAPIGEGAALATRALTAGRLGATGAGVVTAAARAGVEGAAFGAAGADLQAREHGDRATAEQIVMGGLLGAAIGVPLGAGAALVGAGARGIKSRFSRSGSAAEKAPAPLQAGSAPRDAASAVDDVGVASKSVTMEAVDAAKAREQFSPLFGDAVGKEATEIASGVRPGASGELIEPIKIRIEQRPNAAPEIYVVDGSKRIAAAQQAGATDILADVTVAERTIEGRVVGDTVRRPVALAPTARDLAEGEAQSAGIAGTVGGKQDPVGSAAEAARHAATEQPSSGWLRSKVDDLTRIVTGGEMKAIKESGLTATGAMGKFNRALIQNKDEILKHGTETITARATQLENVMTRVRERWSSRALKTEDVAGKIDNPEEALFSARRFAREYDGELRAIEEDITGQFIGATKAGKRTVARNIENTIGTIRNRLSRTVETASSAEDAFVAIENVKREVGRIRLGINSSARKGVDREVAQTLERHLTSEVYARPQKFLEDVATWGKAGEEQAQVNAAYKSLLDNEGAFRIQMQKRGWTKDWEEGRPLDYVDPRAVRSSLEQVGQYQTDPLMQAMEQRFADAGNLIKRMQEHVTLTPAERQEFAKALDNVWEIQQEIKSAAENAALIARATKLEGSGAKPWLSQAAQYSGAGIGFLLAGWPGAVALGGAGRVAAEALQRPVAAAGMIDQFRAFASRVAQRQTKRAAAAVWRPLTATGRVAKRTGRIGARAVLPASVLLFVGQNKSLDSAYEKRREQIDRHLQSPGKGELILSQAVAPIVDDHPQLAAQIADTTNRAIQYLAATKPAQMQTPSMFDHRRAAVTSYPEKIRWARIWSALQDPRTVLDDIEHGRGTVDQIQALKNVYPAEFERLQKVAFSEIVRANRAGKPLPIYLRHQMDLLLELNGAAEPALSSDFARAVDSYRQQAAEREKQRSSPGQRQGVKLSSEVALPQQRWNGARNG